MRDLDRLFHPRSIAVVGASNRKGSVGYNLLHNLLSGGYEGPVYPISVTTESVQDVRAYAAVAEVPRRVDLAVIAVPAKSVADAMLECGEAGVDAAVIVSSGFREIGGAGRKLEEEVCAVAESFGMRILGPNCLGFMRPALKLNATFAHVVPPAGRVAFLDRKSVV